jgi:hypothetical protein
MENTAANNPNNFVYDPLKRYLDAWVDWHDHANQWDVSEVWSAPRAAPDSEHAPRETLATGMES